MQATDKSVTAIMRFIHAVLQCNGRNGFKKQLNEYSYVHDRPYMASHFGRPFCRSERNKRSKRRLLQNRTIIQTCNVEINLIGSIEHVFACFAKFPRPLFCESENL